MFSESCSSVDAQITLTWTVRIRREFTGLGHVKTKGQRLRVVGVEVLLCRRRIMKKRKTKDLRLKEKKGLQKV